jgi:hypothetical protein
MTDIKPIETWYKGIRFRSRLEARWAVFFDALGIRWEYESQGYVIDGRPYLADFWLPTQSTWAEVKPSSADNFEGEHVNLCRGLANVTGQPVLLLTGPPEPRLYNRFSPDLDPAGFQAAFFLDYGPRLQVADEYWFQSVKPREDDGALIWTHADDRALGKSFGKGFVAAISAARSARFKETA